MKVFKCTNHHHHVILSRHFSLSSIASGRSSGLRPVSSHSCCMYVRAGRPAFARPYVGIHRSTSLMSSSLHLQQCPACLVRLTWIVFVMGGRWLYVGALWGVDARTCSILLAGDISTLDGTSLKLIDKFTYLGSSVSSTEKDIDTRLTKAWTAINRLSIIWKSDLIDKMKCSSFQAAVVSMEVYK